MSSQLMLLCEILIAMLFLPSPPKVLGSNKFGNVESNKFLDYVSGSLKAWVCHGPPNGDKQHFLNIFDHGILPLPNRDSSNISRD